MKRSRELDWSHKVTHYPTNTEIEYYTANLLFEELEQRSNDFTRENMSKDLQERRLLQIPHLILGQHMMTEVALYMDVRDVIEQAKKNSVFYVIVNNDDYWSRKIDVDFPEITKYRAKLMKAERSKVRYDKIPAGKWNMGNTIFPQNTGIYAKPTVLFLDTPFRGHYYVIRKLLVELYKNYDWDPVTRQTVTYNFHYNAKTDMFDVSLIMTKSKRKRQLSMTVNNVQDEFFDGNPLIDTIRYSSNRICRLWYLFNRDGDDYQTFFFGELMRRGYYEQKNGVPVIG